MLDVAPTELLLVAVVAVVVIGPKDLPKAMRFAGYWIGRARGVARQFRSGFDEMMRESELADMEKKWSEENARIMREFPNGSPTPAALPAPDQDVPDGDAAEPALTERPAIVDEGAPVPAAEQPELFDPPPAADAPPPAEVAKPVKARRAKSLT